MICSLVKWMISRSIDEGHELPPRIHRHIHKCQKCNQFHQLSTRLAQRLECDATKPSTPPVPRLYNPRRIPRMAPVVALACILLILFAAAVPVVIHSLHPADTAYLENSTLLPSVPELTPPEQWDYLLPDALFKAELQNMESAAEHAVDFLLASVHTDLRSVLGHDN